MRILITAILLLSSVTSALFGQDLLTLIPPLTKYPAPKVADVQVAGGGTSWRFSFNGYDVLIKSNPSNVFGRATVSFTNQQGNQKTFTLTYNIWHHYLERVVAFDATGNGLQDLFIISYRVGVTGIGANAPSMAAFFFYPHSVIRIAEMSSFFGSTELFRDVNGNGKYDFVCIQYLGGIDGTPVDPYYVVYLFSMSNGQFTNSSDSTPGFPLFIQQSNGGSRIVGNPPESVRDLAILKKPDVWAGR